MILYYAMGGGLGHLTRARAFLYTLGIQKDAVILSSSPFAADRRIIGNQKVMQVEQKYERDLAAFRGFLHNVFVESNPEALYLDSFPVGIIGEFADFEFPANLKINYVARRLKWKSYSRFLPGKSLKLSETYILEPLEKEHFRFIQAFSGTQLEIELQYPPSVLDPDAQETCQLILKTKKPFWLVVHSGNESEIGELVNYAREMREIENSKVNLILISPRALSVDLQDFSQYELFPAQILFQQAERIFTACGFNIMQQVKNFKNKHYFIPFERRYDDQFARARRFL